MKIGYLSSNGEKYKEVAAIIQKALPQAEVKQIVPTDEIEETGQTFAENALLKLNWGLQNHIPKQYALDVLITEDAGLAINALDGREGLKPFPGVYTNRWLTPTLQQTLLPNQPFETRQKALNAGILKLMQGVEDRQAQYVCALAIWQNGKYSEMTVFEGVLSLQVGHQEMGEGGFGYDPIMHLPNQEKEKTIAELDRAYKNSLSHRFNALQNWLNTLSVPSAKG